MREQIIGDIHGQICDVTELLRVCEKTTSPLILSDGRKLANRYLFMGDYVDRGWYVPSRSPDVLYVCF